MAKSRVDIPWQNGQNTRSHPIAGVRGCTNSHRRVAVGVIWLGLYWSALYSALACGSDGVTGTMVQGDEHISTPRTLEAFLKHCKFLFISKSQKEHRWSIYKETHSEDNTSSSPMSMIKITRRGLGCKTEILGTPDVPTPFGIFAIDVLIERLKRGRTMRWLLAT